MCLPVPPLDGNLSGSSPVLFYHHWRKDGGFGVTLFLYLSDGQVGMRCDLGFLRNPESVNTSWLLGCDL